MKIDKNIQKKLQNRTFEPSASAWERLSIKLDEQPMQNKRGWFFYIGAAASILLLVSIGIQLFSNSDDKIPVKNEIVIEQIDKDLIDENLEKFNNEIPIEEVIVKNDKVEEKQEVKNNVIANKVKQSHSNKKITSSKTPGNDKIIIAKVEEKLNVIPKNEKSIKTNILKQDPNSRIKINSNDLLYAVTHTKEEVKTYYAKYNIDREDVLKSIKSQLKKSNLKIDANTILAEVERDIDEDDFQNNFMKSLKKRVTNIATAIASRND